MIKVLILEDECKVARFIQRGLAAEGMDTAIAETVEEALRLCSERTFDVCTVDLSLPDADGMEFVRAVRQTGGCRTLVLTARGRMEDKLAGFAAGADDYLPKPFAFDELIARIRALARRSDSTMPQTTLAYADIEMDLVNRRVRRGGQPIELTQREFTLLELFLRNPDRLLTRAKIGEAAWNEQFDRGSNVIEVYVMYLRKKLDQYGGPSLLHTVRGAGYRLSASAEGQ